MYVEEEKGYPFLKRHKMGSSNKMKADLYPVDLSFQQEGLDDRRMIEGE